MARVWPSSAGRRNPPVRPSFDSPTPRTTPRTGTPTATASPSRISARRATPSAGTSPSAPRWNGLLRPDGLSAPRTSNPEWMISPSQPLTAPASMRSAVPSCSRSQAILAAYSAEAQAASRASDPPRRPRAFAAVCAHIPEQKRARASAALGTTGRAARRSGRSASQIRSAYAARLRLGYPRLPRMSPVRAGRAWSPASRSAARPACSTHCSAGSYAATCSASTSKPSGSKTSAKPLTRPAVAIAPGGDAVPAPSAVGGRRHSSGRTASRLTRPEAMLSQNCPGLSAPGSTHPRPTTAIGSKPGPSGPALLAPAGTTLPIPPGKPLMWDAPARRRRPPHPGPRRAPRTLTRCRGGG